MSGPAPAVPLQRRLRVLTHAELRDSAAGNSTPWLWRDVLPASGIALLVGPPYSFKSTLAACLGAAMDPDARRRVIAGRAVESGAMVLCALEHRDEDVSMLLDEAAKGVDLPCLGDVTVVRPPFNLFDGQDVAELQEVAERTSARVIALDSFRRIGDFDENSSGDVAEVHRRLQPLAEHRLVLALHHSGHNGRARGSSDLVAMADATINITNTGEVISLEVQNHRAAPMTIRLRVVHRDQGVTLEEVAAQGNEDELSDPGTESFVYELIKGGMPDSTSRGAIIRAVQAAKKAGRKIRSSSDAIDAAVDALVRQKQIVNLGDGVRGHPAKYVIGNSP